MKGFRLGQGFILGGLLLVGGFLRLWRLESYPPGFTPDEAAQGYTAYSVLKTGRDEWGVGFPLNPRSFGDFKPPLQTYLMIPSVAAFGLNEFAVRLPNALLGSLAILGAFLLTREFFSSGTIGLLAAALLAFSPWHLPLSRGAFEANLTVFFTSFGVYFLLKMIREGHWYWSVLAALFLGLNLFSYHSAKLLTPLVVFLFGIYSPAVKKRIFLLIFGALLLLSFSSFLSGGQRRGLDIAIFHPTDNWQAVRNERWGAVRRGLPDFVARIFHNKLNYSLSQFGKNYLSYFSPQFLFSEGAGEGTYGLVPGRGVLWWELPVLIFGFYWLIKRPDKRILLVLTLVLLAPIPAALTKGVRAANRAAVMMPWIQLLVAASIWQLKGRSERLKVRAQDSVLLKKLVVAGLLVFFLVVFYAFASFLEDYFIQSPRKIAKAMLYGRCQAIRQAVSYSRAMGARQIIVSRRLSEPQAYVLFCLQYPPELAQKEVSNWLKYEEEGLTFIDQLGEYRLGEFVFREINWSRDSRLTNTILVGLVNEFPADVKVDRIIRYPDREKGILIVRSVNRKYESSEKENN